MDKVHKGIFFVTSNEVFWPKKIGLSCIHSENTLSEPSSLGTLSGLGFAPQNTQNQGKLDLKIITTISS